MSLGLCRTLALMFLALCPLSAWAGQPGRDNLQLFVGEITDSHCAKVTARSEFTDSRTMERDKKACTAKCAERGSKIVLYDPSRRRIFTLDDQEKVTPYAGQKVRITGTLRGNEIVVATIENVF